MCKLLFAIKLKDDNVEADVILMETLMAQREALKTQGDGVATFYLKQGNPVVEKALFAYDTVISNAINAVPTSKLIGIHARLASQGSTSLENIHFYKHMDYYFAHNGIVSEYSTFGRVWNWEHKKKKKDNYDVTDSYLFLTDIKKDVTRNELNLLMEEKKFTGIAVLIDTARKIVFTLANRKIRLQTDAGRNFVIAYSFDPEDETKKIQWLAGFPIEEDSKPLAVETLDVEAGVYQFYYGNLTPQKGVEVKGRQLQVTK